MNHIAEPVAVVAQGFGWTAAGAWASFIALLGIIVRQLGPWRKIKVEAEQRLRDDLLQRVEKLEKTLDRERARHNAERALDRHRLNNVQACFDALMLMLDGATPERVADIVGKIKDMRAEQMRAEALEKAAIHAAMVADSTERDDDRDREFGRIDK
jgi:hypothetical protein